MLSDRDKAVVAEMCRTGMALEVLKQSFPQFDSSEVEEVYFELSKEQIKSSFEIEISCNCS